jgi:hypothetical protein
MPQEKREGRKLNVVVGAIFDGQFGEDFTDRRRKLEAVAGAGRGDDDARCTGRAGNGEVVIGASV